MQLFFRSVICPRPSGHSALQAHPMSTPYGLGAQASQLPQPSQTKSTTVSTTRAPRRSWNLTCLSKAAGTLPLWLWMRCRTTRLVSPHLQHATPCGQSTHCSIEGLKHPTNLAWEKLSSSHLLRLWEWQRKMVASCCFNNPRQHQTIYPIGLLWPRLRKGQELQQPELTLPCYCPHINSPSHWVDLWQTYDWKILKECSGWTRAKFTSFQYAFESIWWAKNNSVITSSESWSTQGIRPVRKFYRTLPAVTGPRGLLKMPLIQVATLRSIEPQATAVALLNFQHWTVWMSAWLYQSISYHPTNSRARWYNLTKHNNDN